MKKMPQNEEKKTDSKISYIKANEKDDNSATINEISSPIHGRLAKFLGEKDEATNSLAFIAIILSFGCLFFAFIFAFVAFLVLSSKGEQDLSSFFQSMKGIVECFAPIITLIIGYCLGEKSKKK